MRHFRCFLPLVLLACSGLAVQAVAGKVIKVLPEYLDREGRHALSPSLFDRDAYQAQLRWHAEERSGVRELEAPNAAVRCPGERPLFVPEHLALDEIAWYRRAVDPNERPVAPRACPVNRRRDELLSRP